MIFSHIFLGMIVAAMIEPYVVGKLKSTYLNYQMYIWAGAMLGAVMPDIDLLYVFFVNGNISHRSLLMHSIVPYIVLLLLALFAFRWLNASKIYKYTVIAVFLGVLSHLVIDALTDSLYLFAPLTNTDFLIQPFYVDKNAGLVGYVQSPYMLIELVISFTGLFLFNVFLHKKQKMFRYLLILVGIIELGVAIAIIPFIHRFY